MTAITYLAGESSARTRSYDKTVRVFGATLETMSRAGGPMFVLLSYEADAQLPEGHKTASQLAAEWESADPEGMKEARAWLADNFYSDRADTLKAIRLRKGLSQASLALQMGTSQSHVARIEKGTENITLETCRKLATALGVDLNTLDEALKRQEMVSR